jgi:hypothetical protein
MHGQQHRRDIALTSTSASAGDGFPVCRTPRVAVAAVGACECAARLVVAVDETHGRAALRVAHVAHAVAVHVLLQPVAVSGAVVAARNNSRPRT